MMLINEAKDLRYVKSGESVVRAPNLEPLRSGARRQSDETEERQDGRIFLRFFQFFLGGALLLGADVTHAQISMRPEALTHYSFCISHAKDRNNVFLLDRGTMYRCGDEIAVAYFNYLGRQRVPEKRVSEREGVFIYRMIAGVGKCWNKIEDTEGNPMSLYGCDIYVEL